MRILSLLALGAVLAALWTLPALHATGVARSATTVAPVALIDLGSIFGDDENEPDENETDGGERGQQPSSGRPAFGSHISLAVVGLTAGLVQGGLIGQIVPRLGERRALLLGLGISALSFLLYGLASAGWMMYAITRTLEKTHLPFKDQDPTEKRCLLNFVCSNLEGRNN